MLSWHMPTFWYGLGKCCDNGKMGNSPSYLNYRYFLSQVISQVIIITA